MTEDPIKQFIDDNPQLGKLFTKDATARITELEAQLAEYNKALSTLGIERDVLAYIGGMKMSYQMAIEAAEARLEQFAKDIALKLGIDYGPPVEKGECGYLVALEALKDRAETAEAQATTLREVITKVAEYLESEQSPLYSLWENGDICSWDENPRESWKDVVEDLQNPQMATLDIGHGVEWDSVTIYRVVRAALAPKGDK
jgi:hypothetical protein